MTALQSILEEEVGALRAVLLTLEDEHAALLARTPDGLQAASQAKAAAVARALGLEQQRQEFSGKDAGEAGDATAFLRAELRNLAAECRTRNDRNGLLINGQRRRVEASLNVLRGRAAVPDVYGRDGTGTFERRPGTPLASY